MDDIDRANDALERATERHREQLVGRALRPARVYDCCRWCHEPLTTVDLRHAGFCTVGCREDFEQTERVARITGKGVS